MLLQDLRQTWELDSVFPGGSDSKELLTEIKWAEEEVKTLFKKTEEFTFSTENFLNLIFDMQRLSERLSTTGSFVGCLIAQDVHDKKAMALRGRLESIYAAFSNVGSALDKELMEISEDTWADVVNLPEVKDIAFTLNERRMLAKEKLGISEESLINDLAVDGYHAWSTLYDLVVGRINIKVEIDGKEEELSVGQAENKFSNPDRQIRKDTFEKFVEAWDNEAEFCAASLNHIAGFRNEIYKHRGWKETLKEPLAINRMKQETLTAMWDAISSQKDIFVKYLDRKAELLGLEKLSWYDVDAPLSSANSKMSYDESAQFIVEHFRSLAPKMADFSEKAFLQGWIEAEDRAGKRPGGFCTGFPTKKETRIFMTFSGTLNNVSTLAHELGHAFHSDVLKELPYYATNYAMNVAETASTFAEMIVADAAVTNAKTKEEKIALLEDKAQRSVAFFMNIHARFLFETRMYEERKNGQLSVERLCELMEEAQKEAFNGALAEYHPYFWASKLHFYITDVPFYNFPYTFGYLFSAGIYAKAKEEGPAFEEKYIALLQDTGKMEVEELAQKHLGIDITKQDFWLKGIELAAEDVEEFLELTQK
ncbi:M3 family oligoendopeptidase [Fictibacillus phosphorivorans]|uniref:M3 family oligoendopeptidase n=1 Tax=Fictibacillus phosphorivorans TaxID=1221500 RepID=UPI00203D91AB|nr:M3 family oligoendopeptidase [Fictibacillus phosphorivorans]MCM3716916.1 M3 family oligoendopeptidase [Fictibacillus phosphorivorans]MCM3774535.1 M3 family oligoendopeptidase [Fictibacillus phosphorivorans]